MDKHAKSGIGILLGIGSSDKGLEDEKELAASALIKAVHRKDKKAVVEAFLELLDSFDCEYADEEDKEEVEEDLEVED